MRVQLRLARKGDLPAYTDLLQRTYELAFPNPTIGLTKTCFSKEVFATDDTQAYLKSNLLQSVRQRTWLAIVKNKPVGAITLEKKGTEYEMRGFYVDPAQQGRGIGKLLWKRALPFAESKPIILDLYTHSRQAIDLYKRWGFIIDRKKKRTWSHWPEWPKGVRARRLYMRLGNTRPVRK